MLIIPVGKGGWDRTRESGWKVLAMGSGWNLPACSFQSGALGLQGQEGLKARLRSP